MARKGRIYCPVNDETRAALERLAKAQGSTLSRVAGDYLDSLQPQFLVIAEAIEAARTDPNRAAQILREFQENGEANTADVCGAMHDLAQGAGGRS